MPKKPAPELLRNSGASSLRLMPSGTPQLGWKTIVFMSAEKIGVGHDGCPTMILSVWMTLPFLTTRVRNSGTLSHT